MTSIYLPNEKEKLVKLYVPDKNKPTHFVMELVSLPENRFDMELIGAINNALDIVDTAILSLPDDKKNIGGSLITTSSGKFFSNGFNLQKAWKNVEEFYPAVQKLYARFLTFRVPTIAAINGHAFAGGCMLAFAHDYRVMREDRGFICMNEIDIGLPLLRGMASIIKLRINDPSTLRKCALEGHRFTAQEAVKAGFVEQAVPEKEIMPTAFKYAEIFAKKALNRGEAFRLIKTEVHRETIIALLSNELKPGSYLSKL